MRILTEIGRTVMYISFKKLPPKGPQNVRHVSSSNINEGKETLSNLLAAIQLSYIRRRNIFPSYC